MGNPGCWLDLQDRTCSLLTLSPMALDQLCSPTTRHTLLADLHRPCPWLCHPRAAGDHPKTLVCLLLFKLPVQMKGGQGQ